MLQSVSELSQMWGKKKKKKKNTPAIDSMCLLSTVDQNSLQFCKVPAVMLICHKPLPEKENREML